MRLSVAQNEDEGNLIDILKTRYFSLQRQRHACRTLTTHQSRYDMVLTQGMQLRIMPCSSHLDESDHLSHYHFVFSKMCGVALKAKLCLYSNVRLFIEVFILPGRLKI